MKRALVLLPLAAALALFALAVRRPERVVVPSRPSATPTVRPSVEVAPSPAPASPPPAADPPARGPALDAARSARVAAIRTDFAARLLELHRTTDWTLESSRLRFESAHRVLMADFDRAVVAELTPAQAERWLAAPEWRRSPDARETEE